MEEKKFYTVQQRGRIAELAIFGPIRSIQWEENDVTAWNVLQELRALDADEIHVRINCPGGSLGEAFAIYNVLREHPAKVTTYADGYVASAAIYPFLAGERRVANPVSAFYFHPVQMGAYGGPDDLRKAAAQAELLTEQGIKAFEAAGIPKETARELVGRDDFATPEEMVKLGVATELGQQDSAEDASQSILPMVAQLLREHRQRKQEELANIRTIHITNGQKSEPEEPEALKAAKFGEIVGKGPDAGLQEGTAEARREAEEQAGRLPALQKAEQENTERPGLRAFFDGLLRDIVQGTPAEGAEAPVGLLNDPEIRGDLESGEKPDNRLGAWLGLRGAE